MCSIVWRKKKLTLGRLVSSDWLVLSARKQGHREFLPGNSPFAKFPWEFPGIFMN